LPRNGETRLLQEISEGFSGKKSVASPSILGAGKQGFVHLRESRDPGESGPASAGTSGP